MASCEKRINLDMREYGERRKNYTKKKLHLQKRYGRNNSLLPTGKRLSCSLMLD